MKLRLDLDVGSFVLALGQKAQTIVRAGVKATEEEAEAIKARAVELAPLDTGDLRKSAYVKTMSNGAVEVGFSARHAIAVHESTERQYRHGQAKFLEQAIVESKKGMGKRLAKRIRRKGV